MPVVMVGNWSLWVLDAGLACCAVECAAALRRLPASGLAPGGAPPGGPAPAGSMAAEGGATGRAGAGGGAEAAPGAGTAGTVLIVAGTVTDKLAPLVARAYRELPRPRYVISFGACSSTGGPYWDSYCVTKGADQFVPVDVYVPGCPPRPEALLHGLRVLAGAVIAGAQGRP
jgi:NADH-quinone oxidoreductase subunit B